MPVASCVQVWPPSRVISTRPLSPLTQPKVASVNSTPYRSVAKPVRRRVHVAPPSAVVRITPAVAHDDAVRAVKEVHAFEDFGYARDLGGPGGAAVGRLPDSAAVPYHPANILVDEEYVLQRRARDRHGLPRGAAIGRPAHPVLAHHPAPRPAAEIAPHAHSAVVGLLLPGRAAVRGASQVAVADDPAVVFVDEAHVVNVDGRSAASTGR